MKKYIVYLGLSLLTISCSQNIQNLDFSNKSIQEEQKENWEDNADCFF